MRLRILLIVFALVLCRRGEAQSSVLRRTDIQKRVNPALLERAQYVSAGVRDTLKSNDTTPVRPGDVIAVPTGTGVKRDSSPGSATNGSATDEHVDLPVRLVTVDRSGTQVLTLSIRVAAEGGGLTFNEATKDFSGDVLIGIEDSARRNEQIALGRPMELQITSDAGRVEPQTIRIAHTNIPWQRVKLVARSPRDTVHVVIRAVFAPDGHAAPILVDRPRIEVRPAAANIQGLGLEAVRVTVTVPQFLRGDTVTLTLWSDNGGLDASTLRIPPSGTAEVGLRSSGLGRNTIHAEISGIALGQAPIRYTLPWPFLLAAVLGGVLGTLIRRREKRLARADFVAGIVAGLFSAVAYAIGLNVTGIDLNVRVGEAAVLVVATLGAGLDLPGLMAIRKRVAESGAAP